jgi:hypothetical protein
MNPRHTSCIVTLVLVLLASSASARGDSVILVPFGSSGIRYRVFDYAHHSDIPDSVLQRDYDDSDWSVGTAPFGGSSPDSSCVFDAGTLWGLPHPTLVARVWVDIPAGTTVLKYTTRYHVDHYVWINGRSWSAGNTHLCPFGSSTVQPPQSWQGPVWTEGLNLFVFAPRIDAGYQPWGYLDFEISCEVEPVNVHNTTWSVVKALYR